MRRSCAAPRRRRTRAALGHAAHRCAGPARRLRSSFSRRMKARSSSVSAHSHQRVVVFQLVEAPSLPRPALRRSNTGRGRPRSSWSSVCFHELRRSRRRPWAGAPPSATARFRGHHRPLQRSRLVHEHRLLRERRHRDLPTGRPTRQRDRLHHRVEARRTAAGRQAAASWRCSRALQRQRAASAIAAAAPPRALRHRRVGEVSSSASVSASRGRRPSGAGEHPFEPADVDRAVEVGTAAALFAGATATRGRAPRVPRPASAGRRRRADGGQAAADGAAGVAAAVAGADAASAACATSPHRADASSTTRSRARVVAPPDRFGFIAGDSGDATSIGQ